MKNITIQSIELINFMCHRHLTVEFKKNITCIGGRNGSGKSAIMIAIGIVLGQRASSLERGNSYKSLIKSGEQISYIKIKLKNSCNFKPEFFGNFIFIEKRMRKDSSTLIICNENKRTFSTKKDDLDYILDLLSLKITNPLNFLTQENSKKFLNVTKKEGLYDFFLKGTEIEDIKHLHDEARIESNTMKERIQIFEKDIKEINSCIKREQNKIKILEEIRSIENKIEQLEIEKEFSKIDVTKTTDSLNKEIRTLEDEMDHLSEQNNLYSQRITEYNLKVQKMREEIERERSKKENKLNELCLSVREEEKKILEIENDLKSIKSEIIEKDKKINRNKQRKTLEDKDFEEEYKNVEELIKENEDNKIKIENETLETKNKIKKEDVEIKEIEDKKYYLEKQIAYYKKMRRDKLLYFHENIAQILSEIRNTKFKDQVIGPIGLEIELKDIKWYKTVSIILKNIISNFIVFNQSDRVRLSQIFSKYKAGFSIYTASSKNRINFYRNNEYKTLVDILDVKNVVVMNQLIILQNIEQIILIENRSEAYKVIRKDLKNIDCAYTLEGDRIKLVGGGMTDYRHKNLDRHFFETTENKLEEATNEFNEISKMPRKSSRGLLADLESQKESLSIANDKLNRRLAELKQILEDLKEEEDNTVEEERDLLVSQRQELENVLLESQNFINFYNNEISEIRSKKDKRIEIENIQDIHLKRNVNLNRITSLESRVITKRNNITDLLMEYATAKEQLLGKYKNLKQEIIPREKDVIELDILQLKTKIEESKRIGDEKNLKTEIEELKIEKQKKEEIINLYSHKIDEMIKYIEMRTKKRDDLLHKVSEEASNRFKHFTSKRNYIGTLIFNHDDQYIELNMKINKDGAGGKGTLSGGERSFAAMCFLLSLWPSVICPVKVLDEFDVFMDNVNRNCTLKLLLDYFIEKGEQVILITPLNVKELINEHCDVVFLDHNANKS
ncbi:DNA repair protein rad18 [Spraguea lophii 42_110]|uniref:DNA repair protein rad18 n=1 Tax=Spraguea lophii (strain 42_110) TaxID=1358809 RepID=S7WAC5_SPRLO|nr:DNA repair protein rad18 [Spraguea lophii 42_110]